MHESEHSRVADFKQAAKQDPKNVTVPEHLSSLPDDTHIVSGVLVGNGAVAFASEKAKLSAKVVKLERTSDGGVAYQFAVFVSEPAPAKPEESKPVEDPRFLTAVDYFVGKGLSDKDARKQVNQFGVERVLAAREKELDKQLEEVVSGSSKKG